MPECNSVYRLQGYAGRVATLVCLLADGSELFRVQSMEEAGSFAVFMPRIDDREARLVYRVYG